MSLKVVQYVSEYCDHCEGESGYLECIGDCGKVFCRKCEDAGIVSGLLAHINQHPSYYICQPCEKKARETGKNALYNACVLVGRLKLEVDGFYASYEPRRKSAEAAVEAFSDEMRKRSEKRRQPSYDYKTEIIGPYVVPEKK
jgi:hypothetical protein